jgi:hypothetical protein
MRSAQEELQMCLLLYYCLAKHVSHQNPKIKTQSPHATCHRSLRDKLQQELQE